MKSPSYTTRLAGLSLLLGALASPTVQAQQARSWATTHRLETAETPSTARQNAETRKRADEMAGRTLAEVATKAAARLAPAGNRPGTVAVAASAINRAYYRAFGLNPARPAAALPFAENFDGVAAGDLPLDWTVVDVNSDGSTWETLAVPFAQSAPNALRYNYSAMNAADDWIFTPVLQIPAGQPVEVGVGYRITDPLYPENFEIAFGTAPTAAAMGAPIASITATNDQAYQQALGTIPSAAGARNLYVGFHCTSIADQFRLYLDDVTVQVPAACPAPTALAATAVTGTTATLTFAPGTGTNFSVIYGPTGFNPATAGTTVATTTGSVNVTGLTGSTPYQFYVSSNCGAAGTSTLAGPANFTTQCVPGAVTLPYAENFDAGGAGAQLPCGWSVLNLNADTITWRVVARPTQASSPPNALSIRWNAAAAMDDWAFLPGIQLTAGQSYDIGFKYAGFSTAFQEKLEVRVGTAPTVAAATASVFNDAAIATAVPAYLDGLGSFVAPTTGLYYFGFHGYSDADQFRLFLDDVTVQFTPACPAPTALGATAITSTGATLTFTPGTGTNFSVVYGPTGFNPATGGTTVTTTTGSVAVTGLAPSTDYQFYVTRDCGAAGTSTRVGPFAFRTQCAPPTLTLPVSENFDGVSANTLPCGWTIINANNDTATWHNIDYMSAGVGGASGPNGMRIETDPASPNPKDDWFVSPAVTLAAGQSVDVTFQYRCGNPASSDNLAVLAGTAPTVAGLTAPVFSIDPIPVGAFPNQGTGTFVAPAAGTYYFGWHTTGAAGWRVYVDDIQIVATPACVAPTALGATALTPTGATLTFTPGTGTNFSVVYGPTGFNPATGGTTVTTTTGSVAVTGLTPSTSYQFYVTRNCGAAGNSVRVGPFAFATPCVPPTVTFPYSEGFESAVSPAVPCGIQVLDANADRSRWRVYQGDSLNRPAALRPRSGQNMIGYFYNPNATTPGDDWFFLPAMTIPTGGASLKFWWASAFAAGQIWTESLEVKYGAAATPAAMTRTLFSGAITDTVYQEVTAAPLPAGAAPIYIGFHCNSAADQFFLNLDDISVDAVTGLSNPTLERAVRVYPNPTAGRVTVNVQATGSQRVALTVLDPLGRAVYTVPAADNATQVFDLSHLANGLYTLRIALDDQIVIKRLVVQQ